MWYIYICIICICAYCHTDRIAKQVRGKEKDFPRELKGNFK